MSTFKSETGDVLIAICADGAGSGKLSDKGSALACSNLGGQIISWLEKGSGIESLSREQAIEWGQHVRSVLSDEAKLLGCQVRDLACTLLAAVVGEESAAFVQLGDGGIVIRQDDVYRPVFWPQSGEYVNVTNFITDSAFHESISLDVRAIRIDEVAIFTDGLQMVALEYATQTAFAPFFAPLFRTLSDTEANEKLTNSLGEFLDSSKINSRTDDDKTLILALRQPFDGNAVHGL